MPEALAGARAAPLVMLAGDCDATRIIYHALARELPVAWVLVERPVPRTKLLLRRARRLGVAAAASQAAFAGLAVPVLRMAARARLRDLRARLGAARPLPGAIVQRVRSVNAPECLAVLRALSPTVVVLSGTRIVSAEVLRSTHATFINLHAGITPRYRGTHGAYWAYADGRPRSAGVTVHLVDAGIDTGGILAQARVERGPHDNFATLPYLQYEAGLPLLVAAVREALAGRVRTVPSLDATASGLHHHPGLLEYVRHRLATGAR